MQTQAVKKRQTAPLKKSKGTPIRIPGVNPLMYLEAVDGVDPEDPEEGSGAALFVEAGMEPDIHQSTSAKKAVMNNRYSSMTQLLSHTFAHLTGSSFRLKAKLLPIKNTLGVKYN